MNTYIFCSTRHLDLPPNTFFSFRQVTLTNSRAIVEEFVTQYRDHALITFGTISLEAIASCPYFLVRQSAQSLMQIYNSSNLYTAAHIIHDEIDFFTASLWFLKDNACSTAMLHLYCSEAETAFNKWRTSGQSNSKGEYEVVEFKERELNEALHISNRFRSIITSFRRVDSKQFHMDVDFSRTTRSSFVEEPYNNHDRIGRAFSFISLARQSSLLPLKISLYVASFECLFTNDHSEVTHKVSERGAFYLANDRIEALGIFKTLKAGYAVRSSYLHGQKVAGGTKEKLQDTSTKMDALCRRLFRKILDDHTPFTLNDQELQKWFDQLLFG